MKQKRSSLCPRSPFSVLALFPLPLFPTRSPSSPSLALAIPSVSSSRIEISLLPTLCVAGRSQFYLSLPPSLSLVSVLRLLFILSSHSLFQSSSLLLIPHPTSLFPSTSTRFLLRIPHLTSLSFNESTRSLKTLFWGTILTEYIGAAARYIYPVGLASHSIK